MDDILNAALNEDYVIENPNDPTLLSGDENPVPAVGKKGKKKGKKIAEATEEEDTEAEA